MICTSLRFLKTILFISGCMLLFCPKALFSQKSEMPSAGVLFTEEPITLDGVLDESIWQRAIPATNFWQWFPSDTLRA